MSEPGGTIDFQFSSPSGERIGGMSMEVIAVDPDRQVHWRGKAGPEEWIGTDVVFRLSREDDHTIVHFGHRNWREAVAPTGMREASGGGWSRLGQRHRAL